MRAARKFLAWLDIAHGVAHLTERVHVTHHLLARRSDPCTRNTLKEAHQGQVFLEEMAGSKRGERLSSSPLYANTYKELRNKTGAQDVHFHPGVSGTILLRQKEYPVLQGVLLVGLRAELEHVALRRLQDEFVKGNSFSAKLTRAKTTGEDRELTFRPAYIDSCCFVTKA